MVPKDIFLIASQDGRNWSIPKKIVTNINSKGATGVSIAEIEPDKYLLAFNDDENIYTIIFSPNAKNLPVDAAECEKKSKSSYWFIPSFDVTIVFGCLLLALLSKVKRKR
jgi:hypothetical protein